MEFGLVKWGFYQLKVLLLVALTYLEQSPSCAISKPNLFAGKELGNHVFLTVTNLINIFKLMIIFLCKRVGWKMHSTYVLLFLHFMRH